MKANAATPNAAIWLGARGLLPFVGLAAAIPFLAGDARGLPTHALAAYGAVILSFLGGVQLGSAPAASEPGRRTLGVRAEERGCVASVEIALEGSRKVGSIGYELRGHRFRPLGKRGDAPAPRADERQGRARDQ
jgi:hypothetical protein